MGSGSSVRGFDCDCWLPFQSMYFDVDNNFLLA